MLRFTRPQGHGEKQARRGKPVVKKKHHAQVSSKEHAVSPRNATVPRWNKKTYGLLSMGNPIWWADHGPIEWTTDCPSTF